MEDNKVGYGSPPKDKRFQKGKSGNPSGRPKKTTLELSSLVAEVASKDIVIKEGGKRKKVPMIKALIIRTMQDAMQGDKTAMRMCFDLMRNMQVKEEFVPLEQDEAAMKKFIARMTAGGSNNDV